MLDHLKPGMMIEGRYELIAFLGEGGFARVWRARDVQLGREVAIKLLNLNTMMLDNSINVATVLQRFEREARLAASIHHPNVVQIHDIGNLDGKAEKPFIVMELLTGMDLKESIDRLGPCDPTVFIPQFIACLDGLARAHELGIVHKDLKPSNLFLSDPGRRTETLKLVDFGIAHITQPGPGEEASRLTSTGQLLGTPQYLPPEYIHSQHVSPAMDVYQMSLILIEALTAEYVLGGENSLQCLIIHGDGRLEIPRYLLESALGAVLRQGLARDPAQRYQDAEAFAEALSQVEVAQIPARPNTHGVPLERLRLDGQTLTQGTPHVALAPSLLMGSGARPAVEPGHATRGDHSAQAYDRTLDSIPAMDRPSQPPFPTSLGHPDPTERMSSPPHVKKKGSNTLAVLLCVMIGLGVLGGGCLCCVGVMGEVEEEDTSHINYDGTGSQRAPEQGEVEHAGAGEVFDVVEDYEEDETPASKALASALAARELAVSAQVEEAQQMLEEGQNDEAIALCDRLIREVAGGTLEVNGCYNVILRASWNPVRAFGERERRACQLLGEYQRAYPDHKVGISVQRSIMECVKHDV